MSFLSIILGLIILSLNPAIIHSIAFNGKLRFTKILTSVLIGEYILTFYLILLGIVGLFRGYLILTIAIVTSAIIGILLRRIYIKNDEELPSQTLILSLLFVLFLGIIQHYTYPSVISLFADFPWARLVVREGGIPAFHLENEYYRLYKPPLLYSHIALLFSVQNSFSIDITKAIPLFYTFFTIFTLVKWGRDFGKSVPYFIILALFGWWPRFLVDNTRSTEEIPLLFFTTCSFYFFSYYLKTKRRENLFLLAISLTLAMSSDIVGYYISFMLLFALLYKSGEKLNVIKYYASAHILILIWVLRNYYYYRLTPISYIGGFNPSVGKISGLFASSGFVNVTLPIAIKSIFVSYPLLLFSFVYILRNIKKFEQLVILLLFVSYTYYMGLSSLDEITRYYHHFIGIFALYAGIELSILYDSILLQPLKKNKNKIAIILLLFGATYSFGKIYPLYSTWDKYEINAHQDVIKFLDEHREDKQPIRIFGEFAPALNWYGDAVRVYPESPIFRVLSNNTKFEYNKNDSEYYYQIFKKINVDYIYDGPTTCEEIKWYCFDPLIKVIEEDKRFKLVYNKSGYRLWKLDYT